MYMFYNDQQPCSQDCDSVGESPKAAKGPKAEKKTKKMGKWLREVLNDAFINPLERFKKFVTMNKAGKEGEKDYTNRAHAKGVMNFNDKQGFWVICLIIGS
jgi:hypothetical protein